MLARFLETDVKTFLVNPRVTVALEEQHPVQVSVVGEVVKPGVYKLDQSQGVLHALAHASGRAASFRLQDADVLVVE